MVKKKELCIVHVGMHKTGSSSIQNFLYNDLKDSNFEYIDLNISNQSAVIYSMFSNEPEKYHMHRSKGNTLSDVLEYNKQNKKLLLKSFFKSPAENMIISAEDIMYLKYDELERFHSFLKNYFYKIKIIGYVRPIYSYIESAFQELVKHGLNKIDFTYADPDYKRFMNFYKIFRD